MSDQRRDLATRLKNFIETARREPTPDTQEATLQALEHLLDDAAPAGAPGEGADRPPHEATQRTAVLLVEPIRIVRNHVAGGLRNRGYRVHDVAGIAEALLAVGRRHFDVVVVSDDMPDGPVAPFLPRLRGNHAADRIPLLMLGDHDWKQAWNAGATDHVVRPVSVELLCARLETHLALARTRRTVDHLTQSLHEAHDQITRLEDRALDALKDVGAWAKSMSLDLANTLGTEELGVWIWEGMTMRPLTQGGTHPPGGADLMMAVRSPHHHFVRAQDVVVAIIGMTGELFGGIIVPDRNKKIDESHLRILSSFARQLGGALELQRLRESVEQTELEHQAALSAGVPDVEMVRICQWCGRCYTQVDTCEDDGVTLSTRRRLPYRVQGHYRLIRKLGEGGMGTIFLAHDERLDREVAIKILNQNCFHSTQAHLRFEQEARALARIEHPNVITVYDSGHLEDSSIFIVMERLRGYPLDVTIKKFGRGSPEQVAMLLRQGAAALTAAHHASVLHRDIKPENIFLVESPNGHKVKLLDFGIAKNLKVDTTITQDGMLIGTPAYMAPEQINGQVADVRSDLYSFAAVCYEALVGRPVTLEKELGLVIVDVVDNAPPAPSSLVPSLPSEVDAAFAQALHESPDQRPSLQAWATSLAPLLERLEPEAQAWPFRMQQRRRMTVAMEPPPDPQDVPLTRESSPLR